MASALSSLVAQPDYRFVLFGALVCAAAAFTSFHTYTHAAQSGGGRRQAWLLLVGATTAVSVWATFFLALRSYRQHHEVHFNVVLVVGLFLLLMIMAAVGYSLASRRKPWSLASGGIVVGATVGLMHIAGTQAVHFQGTLHWNLPLAVAFLVFGAGFVCASMIAYHLLDQRRALWVAPGLLYLGIWGSLFGAVSRVRFVPDATVEVPTWVASGPTLAIVVSGITILVMVAARAAVLVKSESEREAFALNRELVDAAFEGLVIAKAGKIVNVNHRLLELTGHSLDDLLGRRVVGDLLLGAFAVAPPSTKAVAASLKSAMGDAIPVEIVCRPLLSGARGDEVYAIRDLTEQQRAEQELLRRNKALQEREEELRTQNTRFEATLANMPHGLVVMDADRRLVVCNKRYVEMYDLPVRLVAPGTRIEDIFEHLIGTGLYTPVDGEHYRREGHASLFQPAAKIRRLSDGRIILVTRSPMDGGWIAIHDDITERERLRARLEAQNALLKRREAELESQKADLDVALANMSQGLAMFDAEERLVVANAHYAEIYGLEPEHLRPGTTLRELVEHRISGGLYQGLDADDVVRMMRERVALKQASQFISRPGDGRILSVSVHPRAEGGWVVTLQDITEREGLNARLKMQNALLQQREAELAAQNTRFDAAISNMSQGMCLFDAQHEVVFANDRYAEIYGLAPEQVKSGTTLRQIFEARAANGFYEGVDAEAFVRAGIARVSQHTSGVIKLSDGRFISVVRRPMPGGGLLSTHEDITEREQLNAQLARQNELLTQREHEVAAQNVRLDAALENMLQGLAMYDAGHRLVICNKRYAEIYGLAPNQVQPGTHLSEIIAHRIANGEFPGRTADELIEAMLARLSGEQAVHYNSHLSDGRDIAVSVQPMPGGGTVTTHHDITEQRRSEAKIAHMALHDTLTGLPNRVLLNERLENALRRVKRGEIVAVHLLDLDHFKTVNDTLGHPAGDRLLKIVADRLRALVRETDTIARMGGDEFAIIQAVIAQPADATSLAHRVIETVGAPYLIEGHQVVIGASIGIAVGPSDGVNPEQLMRNADLALYRAKGDGRGTYRFFESEMDAQMQVRRGLEDDLRKALPAGQFELYYQPVVNLASNEISGFEALIRWRHPEKGLVSPRTFIPLAEEIGFIVQLGEWAIRQACAMAATWPGELRIAVNLSPAQFRSPGLVQVVVGALATSGLAADRLELEITESTLLQDSEVTLSTLYQLRSLGVRIAMDDFGTGYSSLSYLQSFPFDKIKIDQSFVKDIADGVGSLNIVRAVAALANGLGMTTTAEGVETNEQLETVRAEGCTEMQGFVFSRPLPADQVALFLRSLADKTGKAGSGESATGAA